MDLKSYFTTILTIAAVALFAPSASADPAWLMPLSATVREAYDDNLLAVSGLGLAKQSSWITAVDLEGGVSLAPLLNAGPEVRTFDLSYQAERADYHQLTSENYTSHRFNLLFQGKGGQVTYSLTNAFLYMDGSKFAEIYALNQLSGAAGNQADKYRNNHAHALPRERRNQDQDRYTAQVKWDAPGQVVFVRGVSTLTYYNLNTYLFNTAKAPYLGYQNYVDRWDINAGADLGFNVTPKWAFTVGYRDGDQHQDQFALAINSDQHFSSNHYQRVLFGVEGSPVKGVTLKFAAGPDFRDFNPNAPMSHDRTTRYYGEGTAAAALPAGQTLSLTYRQWIFVSSTGVVPYDDITYILAYHLPLLPRLALELGAKYWETNYTLSNDVTGSAPSLRDDLEYEGSAGLTFRASRRLTITATYVYDQGQNGLKSLPPTLYPAYRDFERGMSGVAVKYTF